MVQMRSVLAVAERQNNSVRWVCSRFSFSFSPSSNLLSSQYPSRAGIGEIGGAGGRGGGGGREGAGNMATFSDLSGLFVGFPVNNSTSDNAQNSSFTSSGFATAPSGSPSVFGNIPAFGAVPSTNPAITTSTPAPGFGKPEITSAASFSFKTPAASGFGSAGFSGFPAPMAAAPVGAPGAPAFGNSSSVAGFGSPGSHSHSPFSKSFSGTHDGHSSTSTSVPISNGSTTTGNELFTPKHQLTAEELGQFQAQKFTLGRIPLKPPPVELLNI